MTQIEEILERVKVHIDYLKDCEARYPDWVMRTSDNLLMELAAYTPRPSVEVVARAVKQKWDAEFEGYMNGEPIHFAIKKEAALKLAQAAIDSIFNQNKEQ